MKPEQWVIEDMRSLRKKEDKSFEEEEYLKLLTWYTKTLQEKSK